MFQGMFARFVARLSLRSRAYLLFLLVREIDPSQHFARSLRLAIPCRVREQKAVDVEIDILFEIAAYVCYLDVFRDSWLLEISRGTLSDSL